MNGGLHHETSQHRGTLTIALGLSGCAQEPLSPTADELVLDPPLDLTEPPSGGSCPNVYWESEELLDDGLTVVRWTSGFGGFEYEQSLNYTGLVTWSVDGGSATLTSAEIRSGGHTWTPRGRDSVDGTLVSVDPPFTVNMFDMHRGDEDTDGDGIPERDHAAAAVSHRDGWDWNAGL